MITFLFYEHDMETVLGAEGGTDLAEFGIINGLFERVDITERSDPSQFATGLLNGRVGAYLTCYIFECFLFLAHFLGFLSFAFGYLFADCDALVGVGDLKQGFFLLLAVRIHRALDSDMRRTAVFRHMAPTHLDEAIHGLGILQVLGRSLRAIAFEFFLECLGGVDTLCFGFGHFEFEIDEHVEVLVHGFGIERPCLVVLLIDVEELLSADRFAVDGHQRLVCKSTHTKGSQCNQKKMFFHIVCVNF